MGNYQYSAPEQRTPGAPVDKRADIFALGLILNEMFTGHVPQGSGYPKIASVAPGFAYLDDLVEAMRQQKPENRIQTIVEVKEELIARGHRFVELQRLDTLKKQVVPESDVDDPILRDPIRPVGAESYSDSALVVRLNQAINPVWEQCFRYRATAYSSNFSAAVITFKRDRAILRVTEHFIPSAVHQFTQFCDTANEEYKSRVEREHRESIERRRAELERRVARQEHEAKVLSQIKFNPPRNG